MRNRSGGWNSRGGWKRSEKLISGGWGWGGGGWGVGAGIGGGLELQAAKLEYVFSEETGIFSNKEVTTSYI